MSSRARGAWLAVPLFSWLLVFLAAPLAVVFAYSFFRRGPYGQVEVDFQLGNYARVFDPLYLGIFWKSAQMAVSVTAATFALGLPLAMALARAPARWRTPLMTLLMTPFLSNFVVRAYAIKVLLGIEGPIAALAGGVGYSDSAGAVWLGMLTNYLPFMVLPLYVALARFDFTLVEAAKDLGASDRLALWRVILPGIRVGIVSGALLVFVPALGEFLIPDLLGGARTMLLGNLVTEQFLKARDWPFGAALVMLLVVTMTICFIGQKRLEQAEASRG